jgi:TorA maturation chaperone TorD
VIENTVSAAHDSEMAALSGVYGLLARLWIREIDAPLLVKLSEPPLRELFAQVGGVLPEPPFEHVAEQLAVEFCQLFIGPKDHLPPFQSVWQTGQFQSQAAISMRDFVETVGFELDVASSAIPIDHLGIQLDIMSHIARQCSLTGESEPQASQQREVLRSFFMRHLTWSSRLLNVARNRAQSDFYRSMIGMTANFLQSEQDAWQSEAVDVGRASDSNSGG